jgi:hypothetical protein
MTGMSPAREVTWLIPERKLASRSQATEMAGI